MGGLAGLAASWSGPVLGVWTTRQLWFDGLVNGMVFGLLALGIVLVYPVSYTHLRAHET